MLNISSQPTPIVQCAHTAGKYINNLPLLVLSILIFNVRYFWLLLRSYSLRLHSLLPRSSFPFAQVWPLAARYKTSGKQNISCYFTHCIESPALKQAGWIKIVCSQSHGRRCFYFSQNVNKPQLQMDFTSLFSFASCWLCAECNKSRWIDYLSWRLPPLSHGAPSSSVCLTGGSWC